MNRISLALTLTCLLSTGAVAAELDGVKLPDSATVDQKPLVLNGMGTRKATIFKKKIYVAGLYVEKKEQNPDAILASPGVKKLDTHFVYDVDAKKIRDTWKEGFENNCQKDCDRLKPALEKLLGAMADMKSGDQLSYTLAPDYVEVAVKGGAPVKIAAAGFARVLLANWLGEKPADAGLKKGLLGLVD